MAGWGRRVVVWHVRLVASCFIGGAHQTVTDILFYSFSQVFPTVMPLDSAEGFVGSRVTCFRVIVISLPHIVPEILGNQKTILQVPLGDF